MRKIYCDCCGEQFEYGRETAKTNGKQHTVYLDKHNETRRMSATVEIKFDAETGADVCAGCRKKAIDDILAASPDIMPEL